MTASSVELFPCQVQLIGLPRSTSSAAFAVSRSANLEDPSVGINKRITNEKVKRVSRNLFGAPDPIEMKNLYQQEAERQRNYILERYTFDSKTTEDAKEDIRYESTTNKGDDINYPNSSFKTRTVFPNLIEQELKQHDQHRHSSKQSFCRTSLEETPSNTSKCKHANYISDLTRCRGYTTTAFSPAIDHQKPYTRQSLITEKFNIRKSKVCLSRNTKSNSCGVITTNNLEATRNVDLPQLLESNICNIKHEANTKSAFNKTCVEDEKDSNSALICKDTHTAVALQLVVSTKNLS